MAGETAVRVLKLATAWFILWGFTVLLGVMPPSAISISGNSHGNGSHDTKDIPSHHFFRSPLTALIVITVIQLVMLPIFVFAVVKTSPKSVVTFLQFAADPNLTCVIVVNILVFNQLPDLVQQLTVTKELGGVVQRNELRFLAVQIGILLPVFLRFIQHKGNMNTIVYYGVGGMWLVESLEMAFLLDTIQDKPGYYSTIKIALGIGIIYITLGNTFLATWPMYVGNSRTDCGMITDIRANHQPLFAYLVIKCILSMFFIDIALLVIRIIVLVDSGNQGDQLASSFYVWVAKDAISMVTLFIHLIYVCWSRSSEETHTDHYEVVINIEADKIKTRKSLREGKCVKFSYALSAFFVIGVVIGIGIGVHKAFLV